MKINRFSLFSTLAVASALVVSPSVGAAITWDAGGGDNNWSTFDNWSSNASPASEDVTFNTTGAAASGTTNTVSANESIASLSYSFDDATLQHTTAIGAGQILDVAGTFLLAGSTTAANPTNVTLTGATGAFTVAGALFQVGQTAPGASGSTTNSLDMSGLGTFTANLGGSGIFRLGASANANTTGAQATVKLAATSSITTDLFGVGDRAGRGITQTVKLGSVANTINANTVAIGSTNGRGSGNLSFETGTGTLTLRAADGSSAVTTMNMVNNGFNHNGTHTATVNLAGHSVDAKIGALTMARRTGTGSAGSTASLTFDTGTLEVTSVNMAVATNAAMTGANNATINIGGGTATFGPITMATNNSGGATTGTLNFTGGTTTVNGDIVKAGGTGTSTANLSLNGASAILDMTGDDLTNLTAITYTDGQIKNLGIVNTGITMAGTGSRIFDQGLNISGSIQGNITGTGVGLTKQGAGILSLFGTNTYDGPTQIDDGMLVFGSKNAKAAATATAAALGSVGLGVHDANATYYSAAEVGALFNTNSLAGFNLDAASGVLLDTTNAGGSFTQNVALAAGRALSKSGNGTLILPSANSFTGNVTINGIANSNTLRIEHSEALGPIATAKTITLTGDNRMVSILELANNVTVDANKAINTSGKSFLVAGETTFGTPVFLRNASGNNAWLGDMIIVAAGGAYSVESASGTLTLGAPATTSVVRNDVSGATIRSINFLGAGDVVMNTRFVEAGSSTGMNKHGTGTLTLARTDNQASLATPVFAAGTTVVESMADSGNPSSIGSGTGFSIGGTFRHAGASASSSNRAFGLVGPATTIESSGSGTLSLTSTTPVAFVNGAGTTVAAFASGATTLTCLNAFTLFPGMTIAGTGIAVGSKITAVNYDTREITLDLPTISAQATHVAVTITGTADLNRSLTLGGTNTGDNLLASPIANPSGAGKLALTKGSAGKWILTGANTYTGNTTISGGRLTLGATNVLPDTSPVSIGTATLDAATAGTEDAGTLDATGAATINLAPGAKIEFDHSNGTWSGTLNLTGAFVSGSSLRFGTTNSGLSASQISQISAVGFTGFALDGSGFLTATPSGTPYTIWAATFLPADVSNPAGDNDGDGLVNQQEFAYGLNPLSGSSVNSILVQLNKTTGTFSYQRRAGTGLNYKILTSPDLVAWTHDATAGQAATSAGSNETVVVTLTGVKPLTATKLFVRVAAE
jgi:autotransporter-associated beta strand protein